MRFSHKTDCSFPDKARQTYEVYTDHISSKNGSNVTWYTSMCTFKDGGQMSVSKFNKVSGGCTKKWAENEIRVADLASAMAMKFNHVTKSLSTNHAKLEFLELRMARLDKTAIFSKKRRVGDYYTFEEKLENFKRFIDNHGLAELRPGRKISLLRRNSSKMRTISESSKTCVEVERPISRSRSTSQALSDSVPSLLTLDEIPPPPYYESPPSYEQSEMDTRMKQAGCQLEWECGTCPTFEEICRQHSEETSPNISRSRSGSCHNYNNYEFLHAFIHYFFTQTNGEIAICDLSGTQDDDCSYTLTSPTFHSLNGRYGAKDKGEAGIRELIHHHRCTQWCRHLADMTSLLESAMDRRRCIATTKL